MRLGNRCPKIRTMEIIDELEKQPSGVYTGAIGYFSPEGKAIFNVPIRTIVLNGRKGEMGIGSGIVADSSPDAEWQECLLKARFLTSPLPEFHLIETIFHDRDGYLYFKDHLDRLLASASYFQLLLSDKEQMQHLWHFGGTVTSTGADGRWTSLRRNGGLQLPAAALLDFCCPTVAERP